MLVLRETDKLNIDFRRFGGGRISQRTLKAENDGRIP